MVTRMFGSSAFLVIIMHGHANHWFTIVHGRLWLDLVLLGEKLVFALELFDDFFVLLLEFLEQLVFTL